MSVTHTILIKTAILLILAGGFGSLIKNWNYTYGFVEVLQEYTFGMCMTAITLIVLTIIGGMIWFLFN